MLIGALGTIGKDPDVVAKSRAALDRALAGGAPLEPTVAGAIVKAAATHGDAALFDALVAAADARPRPEEQYRYLYALGDFRDPALVDRGLQRSLSPQLRSQDTALYLAQFLGQSGGARPRAWAFITANWAGARAEGGDFRRRHEPGAVARRVLRRAVARRRSRRSSPRTRCPARRGR